MSVKLHGFLLHPIIANLSTGLLWLCWMSHFKKQLSVRFFSLLFLIKYPNQNKTNWLKLVFFALTRVTPWKQKGNKQKN
jgi:hypothetical protein